MSLANVVEKAKAIGNLIPVALKTVKDIEDALPVGGAGAQKLEMIRLQIESAFEKYKTLEVSFTDVWPAIQSIIAITVKILKLKKAVTG